MVGRVLPLFLKAISLETEAQVYSFYIKLHTKYKKVFFLFCILDTFWDFLKKVTKRANVPHRGKLSPLDGALSPI